MDIAAARLKGVNQFSVLILPHAAISRVASTGQLREATLHPEIIDGPILYTASGVSLFSYLLLHGQKLP